LTADLAINKDDSTTTYSAGGTVTYTVTVQNLSGTNVTGALVSDPRPTNILNWAWTCVESGGASGCDAAASSSADFTDTVNLPVGSSIVYTVTANVVASPTGTLDNTATVTPPTGIADSNTSNNSSTDSDSLQTADVSISKDDGQTNYAGGDTITYTVTVVNLSGSTVTGVVISDPKPTNIDTWTWACDSQGGGASGCDGAASSSNDFTDTVDLPVGGTIVYTVTAVALASPNGNLVNTATVELPNGFTDTNPDNNTDTDTDVLGEAADIAIEKTVSDSTPNVQTNITFTLTVTNLGPDPATGVEVTDNLPNGFTFVSAGTPSQGTFNSGTRVWAIGDMAVNQSETLTITVSVNLTGNYVNTATITASLPIDPVSENNQDSVTVVPDFGNGGGGGGGGGNGNPGNPSTVVTGFIIPVTGFAPNKVTTLNVSSRSAYKPTDLRIEIPAVRVNMPIVGVEFKNGNWDVSWLQDQAGWLNGTAYPTWNGNSVLTAHSINKDGKPGVFSNLKNLQAGEYVFVYTDGYRYTYKVVSNQLLQPSDPSVLKHEDKSFITLITCDTFDEGTSSYLLRTVVRAMLVDVSAVQ
jgi:LPXTG-site transpeptidase (sortase) family protein